MSDLITLLALIGGIVGLFVAMFAGIIGAVGLDVSVSAMLISASVSAASSTNL